MCNLLSLLGLQIHNSVMDSCRFHLEHILHNVCLYLAHWAGIIHLSETYPWSTEVFPLKFLLILGWQKPFDRKSRNYFGHQHIQHTMTWQSYCFQCHHDYESLSVCWWASLQWSWHPFRKKIQFLATLYIPTLHLSPLLFPQNPPRPVASESAHAPVAVHKES